MHGSWAPPTSAFNASFPGQTCSLAVRSGLAEWNQWLSMPTERRSKWMRENLTRENQTRATRAQALSVFLPVIPGVNEYLHSRVQERHVNICSSQWPGAMRTRLVVQLTAAPQTPNRWSGL